VIGTLAYSHCIRTFLNRNINFQVTLLVVRVLASVMGKAQRKKAMRRHNPMRVPDSHLPKGLTSASLSSSKTEAILPIIHKVVFLPALTCSILMGKLDGKS
jgi:hypothetical protein